MMGRVMTGRTVLDHDGALVILNEGDEVPEWAESLIGDHITTPTQAPAPQQRGRRDGKD